MPQQQDNPISERPWWYVLSAVLLGATWLIAVGQHDSGEHLAADLILVAGMALLVWRLQSSLEQSRRAQRHLGRNAEQLSAELQAIFNAAPLAILLVRNDDHVIEHANPAAALMSGYPGASLIGMRMSELFEPAAVAAVAADVLQLLEEGETVHDQTTLRRRDGQKIWLNLSCRTLDISLPQRRTVLVLEDVGIRREMERKLLVSEQRWQFAIDGSGQGVWDWNLETRSAWYSPGWYAMLGYTPSEIDGSEETWRNLIHPDDLPEVLAELSRHFSGHSDHVRCEFRMRKRDGDYIWLLTRGRVAECNANGQPVRIVGANIDISVRMVAEQRLQDSERLYRSLGEALPMALFRVDYDGRILFANQQMSRHLGARSPAEVFGRNIFEMTPEPQRGKSRLQHLNVVQEGRPSTVIEVHADPVTGHDCYLEVTRIPVRNEMGSITGAQGVFRDVTDQVQFEQQLRLTSLVFESSHQGVVICDEHHRVLRVNRGFTRITGYAQEDLVGREHRLLCNEREDAAVEREFRQTIERDGHWEAETLVGCKDGSQCATYITTEALRGADGKVCNYVALYLDISERKASEEHIRYLAQHDQLTELPNRTLLRDRVERAIESGRRSGRQFALLFLDLDRFKNINDSLGHEFGDKLLREAAKRLSASVRAADTVSRHGGDEFVVMLTDVGGEQDVHPIARKLIDAIAEPFVIGDKELSLTLSVGICLYPGDGSDIVTLLRNADTALYAAKQAGRNQYRFYSSEMNSLAAQRLQTENELRRAIGRGELYLEYQPQIELADSRIVGAEALVRWRHPVRGGISPGEFIPIAEESGLIVELGGWVMETACRQYAAWISSGLPVGSLSVNVSGHQFRQRDFTAAVLHCLEVSGLPPARLELEVTETVIMHGSDQVLAKLKELADIGVRLAIDDFGTGYSSLSYLKLFPLDRLKVDQAFVRGLPDDGSDAAITRAVVSLGQNLDLNVLAEGIETPQQREFLQAMGCHVGQGYHFSRPLSVEAFEAYVRAQMERSQMRVVSTVVAVGS